MAGRDLEAGQGLPNMKHDAALQPQTANNSRPRCARPIPGRAVEGCAYIGIKRHCLPFPNRPRLEHPQDSIG